MFNCPLSPEKADRIIGALELRAGGRVVDVGCGTGEFLLRVIERYHVHGTGIDPDGKALAECRKKNAGRVAPELLKLHECKAAEFHWPRQRFDAAICIGSVHAFGGYLPTLQALKKRVLRGGILVVGDIFWRRKRVAAYRKVLGGDWPSFSTDYLSLARTGEQQGLALVYSAQSSPDEWDHFEGSFAKKRYQKALALPAGPKRKAAIETARRWYDAYLKWGRETMGFGFLVFLNRDCAG